MGLTELLPWERKTTMPWETMWTTEAAGGPGAAWALDSDDGNPFGNPVDGRRVLAYLDETLPVPAGGGILAAISGNGTPKTRRQVVFEHLVAGLAMAGAAAKVKLSPTELQAAVAASPGFARAVEIAMNEGDAANVGDGSGLSRWRFARTGNADKPEDAGDAGVDYNDMKNKLRSLVETPAPGWEPIFGVNGVG